MSVSRPARCLFNVPSMPSPRCRAQCRYFCATSSLSNRRRPRFASVKASEMGLVSSTRRQDSSGEYEMETKKKMAERYTSDQLKVIEEAEKAIELDDIRTHGAVRSDPYGLPYLDDLRTIAPVIDKRIKEPSTIPANARWMTPEERQEDLVRFLFEKDQERKEAHLRSQSVTENPEQMEEKTGTAGIRRIDFLKYLQEATLQTGGGSRGSSAVAPALPKAWDGAQTTKAASNPRDPEGKHDILLKQLGASLDDVLSLKVRILNSHRVTNQTRLGKIDSMYVIACAGNGNGMLGIGEGKSAEMSDAMLKARHAAIRALKPVPRYEERTIYGDVEAKVGATKVKLMSRPPGFGLRCQHIIFEMSRVAGIHDLAARVPRARNKMNTVKAAYEALMSQRIPEEVARSRGKKLVDVRKVYYGGAQEVPQVLGSAGRGRHSWTNSSR